MSGKKRIDLLRLLFFCTVFFIVLTGTRVCADVSPAFSENEVRKFFDEYTRRYVEKDIEGFMAFFSKEAIENRMLPYADIYDLYRRTFANSQSLRYQLRLYTIQPFGNRILARGRYDIVQHIARKDRVKVLSGEIQWYLSRENGSLKIVGINYGRDRKHD